MPPAARITDLTAHGVPLAPGPGSTNVMIGGLPAWRAVGDQHACPMSSPAGPDGVGLVIKGSASVLINNMQACRMGDVVLESPGLACGPANQIVSGSPTVMIGDNIYQAMSAAKKAASAFLGLGGEIQGEGPSLDWIRIHLVDQAGEPYAPEPLHAVTTDGKQHEVEISCGQLFSQIPGGQCKFTFPKFYDAIRDWMPDSKE